MAKPYEEIRQEIIDALVGRPTGTKIQPENHQQFALDILEFANAILESGADFVTESDDLSLVPAVQPGDPSILKFANRVYNSQQPNGMGYKIIRKDATFASQVTDTNTIYEIRYDFDLEGATVNIPSGCVLKFSGGKIYNGTIHGDNTRIDAGLVQIFDVSTVFSGSFVIDKTFPEWFGAIGLYYQSSNEATNPTGLALPAEADLLTDSAPSFNKAFSLAQLSTGIVYCQRFIYRVETKITIPSKCTLETQEDTVFDVRMTGTGAKKIVQNYDTSEFSSEEDFNTLSLYPNEFFAPSSMAVAFEIGSVKTKLIGRGVITLIKSKFTIGILVNGTGYQYLDMSYESPYIDIRTVGDTLSVVAPDNRDLHGDGNPSNEIGENGQFYWNETDKTYWRKANNVWAEQWSTLKKGNLFNVSLRIDIGQGWSSGRIIRPKIRLWDMGGWRGVEIYTHNGGWFNDGWWEGSVSNKHGSFISIFTNYDVTWHDFSRVTCQVDGALQYDCRIFSAIRCAHVQAPRTWDLAWSQPIRANQSIDGPILFFGKYVSDSYIYLDTNYKYFRDFGTNNETNRYGSFSSFVRHQEVFSARSAINLFKYRTPKIATYINNQSQHYKLLDTIYPTIDDLISNEITTPNNITPPSVLFDEDGKTYQTIIDCDNSIFGMVLKIGSNGDRFMGGTDINNFSSMLEFFYRNETSNILATKKVFALLYSTNQSNGSNQIIQLKGVGANASNLYSEIMKVMFYTSGVYYLIIYITENIPGYKLALHNVSYWMKNVRSDSSSGKMYGPTVERPNAAPYGTIYFDTTINRVFINLGSSSEQNWTLLNPDGVPTAEFVNNAPGTNMQWKGLDNTDRYSIEEYIETSDVVPLRAELFKNNTTLKKIVKYPISVPANLNLNSLFMGCTNLVELPFIDMRTVTVINGFCTSCTSLKEFRHYDMGAVTNVNGLFQNCTNLETIPLLDWSSVNTTIYTFNSCSKLTHLGGFTGLSVGIDLRYSPLLTRESVLNVFNNLANITGGTSQEIKLHATTYALLSASDLAIATNKGWTISHS